MVGAIGDVAPVIYFEKLATIRNELLFGLRKEEHDMN